MIRQPFFRSEVEGQDLMNGKPMPRGFGDAIHNSRNKYGVPLIPARALEKPNETSIK
jgi:hypothetical protein